MFSRRAFALSSAMRFDSTTRRASSSWRVIELNDSVSTPSSSRLVTGGCAAEIAARHGLGRLREVGERLGQPVGEHHGERDRHEQRHQTARA